MVTVEIKDEGTVVRLEFSRCLNCDCITSYYHSYCLGCEDIVEAIAERQMEATDAY